MWWNLSKEEIQYWIEANEDNSSLREMKGLQLNGNLWKGRYLYSNMHELFFTKFPCLSHEWLKGQS
jgi:hypothetical protein